MKTYKVSIVLNTEAESEQDALNKFIVIMSCEDFDPDKMSIKLEETDE